MKKSIALVAILSMLLLGACKPKKSHYRQVYEQAKQREIAQTDNSSEDDIIVSKPAEPVIAVRKEKVSPVEGEEASRLMRYGVVIGSFQNQTNAYSLKERMENDGYTPVLAINDLGMLRVIVTSSNTREEAMNSRDDIKRRYAPQFQDAWILEVER